MGNMGPVLEASIMRRGADIVGRARDGMERVVRQAAPVGQAVPGGRQPGTLRASTEVSARRQGDAYVLTVRATAEHASFTITPGTAPHIIRPRRRGGLLVFYWPQAGTTVFFPSVNHPGYRGSSWWEDALGKFGDVLRESQ